MLGPQMRDATDVYNVRAALSQLACDLRVSLPGIVQSFNAEEGTVTVRPALSEVIRQDAQQTILNIPDLEDVPILVPRAGGFALTLPVAAGDECLIVFADMCIDEWWQSGCPDNQPQGQLWRRRHDLSDAFALLGPWSQYRPLRGYSTTSAQLRSEDGQTVVDLAAGGVTVTAPAVTVTSPAIALGPAGGAQQALATAALTAWITTSVLPFLQAKGYVGPPVPAEALTTNTKGA